MIKFRNALELITHFEGFRSKPYYATAEEEKRGLLTIGYGFTTYKGRPVKLTDTITKEEAIDLLKQDIDHICRQLKILVPHAHNNEIQAVCSLVFNIGMTNFKKSTLLKLWLRDDLKTYKEFLKWVYQGKTKLKGLEVRREAERALFIY